MTRQGYDIWMTSYVFDPDIKTTRSTEADAHLKEKERKQNKTVYKLQRQGYVLELLTL